MLEGGTPDSMLGSVSARRLIIYMSDDLVEALNRVTATSPQSRSEIICEAVERYLSGQPGPAERPAGAGRDDAFFDRVAEMIRRGLLQPQDFPRRPPEEPDPKSKLWIN